MKKIFFICCLIIGSLIESTAQVRQANGTTLSTAANSSAFFDASSVASWNTSTNIGKGMIFPRVPLSQFTSFGVSGTVGIASNYPTRFDGFIVFNTDTIGVAGVGSTAGTLSRGFWYYENKSTSITGGTWRNIGSSGADTAAIAKIVGQSPVKDSIVNMIKLAIQAGSLTGKNTTGGSLITVTNGVGATFTSMDVAVDTTALKTFVANNVGKSPIKDSITNTVTTVIQSGTVSGQNLTNSNGIIVTGGAGATLKATSLRLDSSAIAMMVMQSPLKDSIMKAAGTSNTSDATVDVSGLTAGLSSPNAFSGATFTPNTPGSTSVVYVNTADGTQWTYNGTQYVTYVASSKTSNFYLGSGKVDASNNKTSTIYRTGAVGIGADTIPNVSAQLDVNSTTKGFLPPRMLKTQRDGIATPAKGLIVYCLDCTPPGIYVYDGTSWNSLGSSAGGQTLSVNCTAGGLVGTYASTRAVGPDAIYSVTITNNTASSFGPVTFSTSDVTLSGVSGLSVSTVSPTTATLPIGGNVQVTYTLSGTPAANGTLTATWSKVGMNCTGTANVVTGASITGTYSCGAISPTTTTASTAVSGSLAVNYTTNNGGAYAAQSIASTGVTGLTATLAAGNLTPAGGTLNFVISGAPTSAGTASFTINIGGKTCTKTITVTDAGTFSCAASTTTISPATTPYSLTNNTAYTGTFSLPYTSGNGVSYSALTLGPIDGLTLTRVAGTYATTGGSVVYNLSGTYTGATGGGIAFNLPEGGCIAGYGRRVQLAYGVYGSCVAVDGSPVASRYSGPKLCFDGSGGFALVESSTFRLINPSGATTTLAGSATASGYVNGTGTAVRFSNLLDIVRNSSGDYFVTDFSNNCIRKVTPTGVVTTFAGFPTAGYVNDTGMAARFNKPTGLAIDASDNIYVADQGNHVIRKITPSRMVTTVAGTGTAGFFNATGTAAQFNTPIFLELNGSGNILYVSEFGNYTIRQVNLSTGVVTTVAGNGVNADADGIGTAASFYLPGDMQMDISANKLYVGGFPSDGGLRVIDLATNTVSTFWKNYTTTSIIPIDGPLSTATVANNYGFGRGFIMDQTTKTIWFGSSCGIRKITAF